ncbi:hypothetical protein PTKU15_44140 [Paraburkholderia terrae]|nr:hypothetical protein PTKU15_44140 [Paraburkholderia terrae]
MRGAEDPTLAEKNNLELYRRRRRRARRMRAGVVRDEAARRTLADQAFGEAPTWRKPSGSTI